MEVRLMDSDYIHSLLAQTLYIWLHNLFDIRNILSVM